jgi:hypothetical protein
VHALVLYFLQSHVLYSSAKLNKLVFLVVFSLLLKPVFPFVEYAVNYKYIAKVLCVNKAKPVLKCNGKCHLMKQLANAAEADTSQEKSIPTDKKNTAKQEQEPNWYLCSSTQFTHFTGTQQNSLITLEYCNLYSRLHSSAVFHPPTLS